MTDDAIQSKTAPSDGSSAPTMAVASADDETADQPLPVSFDRNPLYCSLDRLLAAMGKLDDAAPLFETLTGSRAGFADTFGESCPFGKTA